MVKMFEKQTHIQDTKRILYSGGQTKECLNKDMQGPRPLKLCDTIRAGKWTVRQAQGEALPVPSTAPTCDSRVTWRILEDMDAKIEDETARDTRGPSDSSEA